MVRIDQGQWFEVDGHIVFVTEKDDDVQAQFSFSFLFSPELHPQSGATHGSDGFSYLK